MIRCAVASGVLWVATLPLFAQGTTFPEPTAGVWVTTMGSREVARESFERTDSGWKSAGTFNVMGQKGSFGCSAVLSENGDRTYRVSQDPDMDPEQDTAEVRFAEGQVFSKTLPDKEGPSRPLPETRPFLFMNLAWVCFLDLGQHLKDAPRDLAPGPVAFGVPLVGKPLEIGLIRREPVAFTKDDRPYVATAYDLKLGPLELRVAYSPAGVPLRIEVPMQRLAVVLQGYENLRFPVRNPKTIVDSGPWREKLSKPTHQVREELGVMVAMADGVRLATDVYLPVGEGPWPTVLARTPYRRSTEGDLKGAWYAERGYAFVAQDVRGRFDSEGDWMPLAHEESDGSDTLNWIAAQPWSNQKVGMIGASYVGWVQWYAARSGNPHLTCIVPQVSPPDPDENIPYEGGAFMMGAVWWAKVSDDMVREGTAPDWNKVLPTLPLSDMDDALGLTGSFLDTWLAHPPHDRAYWEPLSFQHRFGTINVPALHISGWFDGDQPGAVQNFVGMRQGAKTPAARAGQFLVMGPWTHAFNTSRSVGSVDFGDTAVVDLDSVALRFFDRYLKGTENGLESEPPVKHFVMGANEWRSATDWPLPDRIETRLYLASAGAAQGRDGDGKLQIGKLGDEATGCSFTYDPADLPEVGDFGAMAGDPFEDLTPKPDRQDTLDYTSPPLADAVDVVGPVSVTLTVSTDAADTDFVVALSRILPDGRRVHWCGGIQRLRYHQDPHRDTPVKPGTMVTLSVDCWATGLRLSKGERIHLEVSSWGWPGYGRNLNTLEPPSTATKIVVAKNTIYHGGANPSCVVLPVIPTGESKGLSFQDAPGSGDGR